MAQAMVPLKDLVQAKTRLAGLLAPSERRALAQAMVEDVLATLATHPAITAVTLVSDDPGAALLAQEYAADCWSEVTLGCSGLNAVVACASARLLQAGPQPLLVLHGDLPLLTRDDISEVIAAQHALQGLVIGCDRRGQGTNLLAFGEDSVPLFCFGADSCIAHEVQARSASVPVQIVRRDGIGLDVDEPDDLRVLLARSAEDTGSKTFALLHRSGLGNRLALALESLGVVEQRQQDSAVEGHRGLKS